MTSPLASLEVWLRESPHQEDGGRGFMNELVLRLRSLGLPIWRVSYALMTMHPEILWRTVQWRDDAEPQVTTLDQPHARLDDASYTKSAVARVRRDRTPIRARLVERDVQFPFAKIYARRVAPTTACIRWSSVTAR